MFVEKLKKENVIELINLLSANDIDEKVLEKLTMDINFFYSPECKEIVLEIGLFNKRNAFNFYDDHVISWLKLKPDYDKIYKNYMNKHFKKDYSQHKFEEENLN